MGCSCSCVKGNNNFSIKAKEILIIYYTFIFTLEYQYSLPKNSIHHTLHTPYSVDPHRPSIKITISRQIYPLTNPENCLKKVYFWGHPVIQAVEAEILQLFSKY